MNDFVLTHQLAVADKKLGKIIVQLKDPSASYMAGESVQGRVLVRQHAHIVKKAYVLKLTLIGIEK
jgi:hypothetical protein